jgi:hypothetical protein
MREYTLNIALLIPNSQLARILSQCCLLSMYLLHTVTFLSPPWTSNEYPQQKSVLIPCIPIKTPCPQHSLKDFTTITILHKLHKFSHHVMSYTYCLSYFLNPHTRWYPKFSVLTAAVVARSTSRW